MSRRKSQIHHSDGWTSILGKGRSPFRAPTHSTPTHDHACPSYTSYLPTTTRSLASKTTELLSSPLWRTLTALPLPTITTIVILGLGSLTGPTSESSIYQLALITALRSHICTAKKLYIQDPAFTAADVRFFQEECGAVVIVHPEAERVVGEETLLFAPHLEYEVLAAALKGRPAIVFCNDLEGFLVTKITGKNEYSEFRGLVRDYKCHVLKGVDGHGDIGGGRAFNHSAIYWWSQLPVFTGEGVKVVEEVGGGPDEKPLAKSEKEAKPLPEDEAKKPDEGVQEITLNIKGVIICVGNLPDP